MTLIGLILYYWKSTNWFFLFRWGIKSLGLALIYFSTYYLFLGFTIVGIIIINDFRNSRFNTKITKASNNPKKLLNKNGVSSNLLNPSSSGIKLLSESEYRESARVETNRALEELRKFCLSPGSQRHLDKIKSPGRFKDFLCGSDHVSMDEVIEYGHSASFNESDLIEDDESISDDEEVINGDLILNGY